MASAGRKMKTSEQKLLTLLESREMTFVIPPFQRNYSWMQDQCDVFLNDVCKTANENKFGNVYEHYFGFITHYMHQSSTFGKPSMLVLIDGQQRITTCMLCLAAIRDLIEDEDKKCLINSRYLKNERVGGGDMSLKVKLKQTDQDWEPYKKIILSVPLSELEKNSYIYKNYKFFIKKLSALKGDGVDLFELIEKGMNNFRVVILELEPFSKSYENPQEIYESMNSIGKPLSFADLVRNYILLETDPDTQNTLYYNYWVTMERTLKGGENVSDFLRDYMQADKYCSYNKPTDKNAKTLYYQFKEEYSVKTDDEKKELLSDLLDYAKIYSIILNGDDSGCKLLDKELSEIRTLKWSVVYSFLLSLLHSWKDGDFSDSEICEIVNVLKIYFLRRRIVDLHMNENKVIPTLSAEIDSLVEATNKRQKMFEILASQSNSLRIPNDFELMHNLEAKNFYELGGKGRYSKFYLKLIEEKLIDKGKVPDDDHSIQVEHIMPQTLTDSWKRALGPDYEKVHSMWVNNIGNLTLIRHNQELGNKDFDKKKQVYESQEGFQISRQHIVDQEAWNEKSIKARSEWIIRYLVEKVLPIPDEMKEANNFNPNLKL